MSEILSIKFSVFDLFKIGPGPSSSHTIGPMRAALDFRRRIEELQAEKQKLARKISVTLYGSLSATGQGHGTDRAVLAGLLGWDVERCDPLAFQELLENSEQHYRISVGQASVDFSGEDIVHGPVDSDYLFSNTMLMSLCFDDGAPLEMEYYSVGGGFIQWNGWNEAQRPDPPYPFSSMNELKVQAREHALDIPALMIENERVLTGASVKKINTDLDYRIQVMISAVKRGLLAEGTLPGWIGLHRKARIVLDKANQEKKAPDRFLSFLNAYALAASEENAAGHIVVTAPTSGSSGLIPGIVALLKNQLRVPAEKLREGLLTAAAIGLIVKQNASISGAEAGCMGEIGTAAAMGAAMMAQVYGKEIDVIEAAAEIALEHHLGMTCDPVGGFVQIPCIERNAVGAVKAYNAYLLASSGVVEFQRISLDGVIAAARDTGRDMSRKYKETSLGGLAANIPEC